MLALASSLPASKKEVSAIQGTKCKDNLKKHSANDDCLCICLDKNCTYMCEEQIDSEDLLSSLRKTATTTSTTVKPESIVTKAKAPIRRPSLKTKSSAAVAAADSKKD